MRALWRISIFRDLTGLGGERSNGRWHTAAEGKRIVYLSEHPALALLEVLVNLRDRPGTFPTAYQLMKIGADESVSLRVLSTAELSAGWQENFSETGLSAMNGLPGVSPRSSGSRRSQYLNP